MDLKYYLSKRQVAGKRGNKRNWILKMNFAWKSKTKQRMVFRIVHIKDSRSYLWAKFGLWTPWVCLGWYEKRSMHYYLEPVCPLFLKINPLKQGRISNQNKDHLGSRYIYIYIYYISRWWSIWNIDIFFQRKEVIQTMDPVKTSPYLSKQQQRNNISTHSI